MRAIGRAARAVVPAALSMEIDRPHLHTVLDKAGQGRLTIVSAGPGWGKTTAVAAWARNRPDRGSSSPAWLSLEPADDSPTGFWALFLQAIRQSGALPPGHALADVTLSGGFSDEVLLTLFRSLAGLEEPLAIVMDDFHVIEDAQILSAVTDLTSHDLPVHLILLTRFAPQLPLHRLRVSGDLTEVTAHDLAFDAQAVDTLAAQVESLHLTPSQVSAVLERTEGWPAGVRLATLHLSGPRASTGLDGFGVDRSVAEYLTAEVLARHSADMRDFLLRTSIASIVTAPLADAIAPGGNALARLEQLERANQFVVAVDRERTSFRYHPLFRDMLQSLLRRDDPDGFRASHRAAARWLVHHGDALAALRHAIAVEDWDLALEVFVEASPSLVGAMRFTLRSLLREIPFDTLAPTAAASLCAASLEFTSGHLVAVQELVVQTRRRLHRRGHPVAGRARSPGEPLGGRRTGGWRQRGGGESRPSSPRAHLEGRARSRSGRATTHRNHPERGGPAQGRRHGGRTWPFRDGARRSRCRGRRSRRPGRSGAHRVARHGGRSPARRPRWGRSGHRGRHPAWLDLHAPGTLRPRNAGGRP